MFKRITSILICFCMVLSMVPAVHAQIQTLEQTVETAPAQTLQASSTDYYTDLETAGEWMTHYLRTLREEFTIRYRLEGDFAPMAETIFEAGVKHVGAPQLGDYLRFSVKRYSASTSYYFSGGYCYMTIDYNVTYRVDDQKKTAINSYEAVVFDALELEYLDGYDSLAAIYQWITNNVAYDDVHVNDPEYDDMFTPYGALVDGKAVCQGYAMLMYRMLMEEGIDCRIITGTGNGGPHAWVIAQIGDHYYNLDPTWDATLVQAGLDYEYFLCSESNFPDHTRDPEFTTDEFTAAYPMGTENYTPAAKPTSGACGDDLTWNLSANGVLTISGTGDMYDYYADVPWEDSIQSITAIVVEEGVTGIGYYAFSTHYRATSLSLPQSLVTIDKGAFYNCSGLTEVTIPAGVTHLGESAFESCESLVSLDIQAQLTTISEQAFESCEALVSVTIPEGVVSLQENCFGFCDNLESVTLPSTLESIAYYAFVSTDLCRVTIPAGVTYIGEDAFCGCMRLKEVLFLGPAPQIHSSAFRNTTANCYYSDSQISWEDHKLQYGGNLTWIATDVDTFCANGHTFGEWYIWERPTCVTSGTKRHDCEKCEAFETAYAKAYGHSYYAQTVAPGENTSGYTQYQCGACGDKYIDFKDPNNLTRSDACLLLQDAVLHRRRSITVAYWDSVPGNDDEAMKLWDEAIGHSGIPNLGDYVMCEPQYSVYENGWVQNTSNNRYLNYADFDVTYSSDFTNEEKMESAMSAVLEELALIGRSDFDKIRIIHDFVCTELTYGTSGLKSHTASGALLHGYAVCQGYALLTYRLMLEAGIDCRYISGATSGGPHGWNIVRLDGVYYNIDTTWDDNGSNNTPVYTYFLRSQENFPDHVRSAEYDTPEFHEQYPMATQDYLVSMGSCGETAQWILYPNGTMEISGTGKVERTASTQWDWPAYRTQVARIVVGAGITELAENLFFDLDNVKTLVFEGNAPSFTTLGFFRPSQEINAYYPVANDTWTADKPEDPLASLQWSGYIGQGPCAEKLYWILLEDGTLHVSGQGEMKTKVGHFPWGLEYATQVKRAILSEGITNIGQNAFGNCTNLTQVTVPASVTAIDEYAFFRCVGLQRIDLPKALRFIGDGAFYNCIGLTEITIPKNVTEIGRDVFMFCDNLAKITFQGDVPQIDNTAFSGVTAIAWYPMGNETWTEDMLHRYYGGFLEWKGYDVIPYTPLENRLGVDGETMTITLAAEGEGISYQWHLRLQGQGGFAPVGTNSPSLALTLSLDMNNAEVYCVLSDGEGNTVKTNTATVRVYGALLLDTPQRVSLITDERKSFLITPTVDCFYLFAITADRATFAYLYDSEDNLLVDSSESVTIDTQLVYRLETGKTYRLETRLRFYDEVGDITVRVTRCHGDLSTQTLTPATCTSAGLVAYTCGACGHRWEETLVVGHTYENGSCIYCGKGESVAGGQCGENLFWELNSDGSFEISGQGAMDDYDMYTVPWAAYADRISSVTVCPGVTSLGSYSFYQCTEITSVTLPESLERLGESVFLGCAKLKQITLPEKVTVIPGWAFFQCNALETITILGQVTDIGMSAFYFCESLQAITLPGSLKTIGENAFFFCSGLKEITIPAGVTEIGEYGFYNCSGVQQVTFLGNAPQMGSMAFYNLMEFPKAYYPDLASWTETVRQPHFFLEWVLTPHTHDYVDGFCSLCGQEESQPGLRGDIDCNNQVDTDDIIQLLLHVSLPTMFPIEADADFDSNGTVDTDDIIKLLLHVSLPDLFPL